jgi:Phage integrase family
MGSTESLFREGVGMIGAWFAAGMWIYSRTRFWEHENRHTLVTELSESGAGDEVIMSIAGHVSRAMLSRYSHVRMEAKRRALDEIATRQNAADEKRRQEAELREQIGAVFNRRCLSDRTGGSMSTGPVWRVTIPILRPWATIRERCIPGCAGINRHVVANERVVQERRSESILAPNLAVNTARC